MWDENFDKFIIFYDSEGPKATPVDMEQNGS